MAPKLLSGPFVVYHWRLVKRRFMQALFQVKLAKMLSNYGPGSPMAILMAPPSYDALTGADVDSGGWWYQRDVMTAASRTYMAGEDGGSGRFVQERLSEPRGGERAEASKSVAAMRRAR